MPAPPLPCTKMGLFKFTLPWSFLDTQIDLSRSLEEERHNWDRSHSAPCKNVLVLGLMELLLRSQKSVHDKKHRPVWDLCNTVGLLAMVSAFGHFVQRSEGVYSDFYWAPPEYYSDFYLLRV